MASTLSAQLQAIKNLTSAESEPLKRPLTRPSILFDPKKAADIDIDTILSKALSGLEALNASDNRFSNFRNTIFSHKSRELDREMMGLEENRNINVSIASYLRLLSGYLHLPSALHTLEYLIRRYKVHVYNVDDLVLCALPYHDTHAFVRIIQLIDLSRNKLWGFLEGVKSSGAPPPRKVIVQQCIRDLGVLETLCNSALPAKEVQPSREVVCFCTAVIVEVLGSSSTADNDTVKRILPFLLDGLNPKKTKSPDYKVLLFVLRSEFLFCMGNVVDASGLLALFPDIRSEKVMIEKLQKYWAGALMIVGLLAARAALAPKLVNNLIVVIARLAEEDAKQLADLSWLRLSLMAVINLVQSQSIQVFPKKSLEIFKDMRDLSGVLTELSHEFKIDKFLCIYLETLADYSPSDDSLRVALIAAIETLPVKNFVSNIVFRVLSTCMKLAQKTEKPKLRDAGAWAREILTVIGKCYLIELRGAVSKFLGDRKMSLKKTSVFKVFSLMFDGSMDMPLEISHSRVWFSLEHPKPEVRRSTMLKLAASGLLKVSSFDSQNNLNIRDAILRRLNDDDLSVVKASLSLEELPEIVEAPLLLKAFEDILVRCIASLIDTPDNSSTANDVAILCLECAISSFQDVPEYTRRIATMMFPLLLVLPKTWRLNIKALELVKKIKWPFYGGISAAHDSLLTSRLKDFHHDLFISINAKTVEALAGTLLTNIEDYMSWLIHCCKSSKLAKTLFFTIILQAFTMIKKEDFDRFPKLFRACLPVVRMGWSEESESEILDKEFKNGKFREACKGFMACLFTWRFSALNSNILVCLFSTIIEAATTMAVQGVLVAGGEELFMLDDLFVLFAASSLRTVLLEQFLTLVVDIGIPPVQFLSKFFVKDGFSMATQEASLHFLASTCSLLSKKSGMGIDTKIQLVLGFPLLLIPLASENQDIRMAAMNCIENLHKLVSCIGSSVPKNGGNELPPASALVPALGDLLGLVKEQRKLISSDANFLPSYLASVLGSSTWSLLAPQDTEKRLNQTTKEAILQFVFSFLPSFPASGKFKVLLLFKEISKPMLAVEETKFLLLELLDRRTRWHIENDKSSCELSQVEIDTLCLLLECCTRVSSSSQVEDTILGCIFKALQVDGVSSEDHAVVQPCLTVLHNLSSALFGGLSTNEQDYLFSELVALFRNAHGSVERAAKETLLRINVRWSTIARILETIISQQYFQNGSANASLKRKKFMKHQTSDCLTVLSRGQKSLSFISSLFDVLLLKKDIENRAALVEPLFKLFGKMFEHDWLQELVDHDELGRNSVGNIQQTLLIILEDISDSLSSDLPDKDEVLDKFNVGLLVECARSADNITRNHVFLLLCSISRFIPDKVLDHILDIFSLVGEAAINQNDSLSQHVFEKLMSALVPYWLSKTGSPEDLLQIFVNVLPQISQHRRLSLILYLLRTLGEEDSLASLFIILFRSLIQSKNGEEFACASLSSAILQWEFNFAVQVCEQYSCITWLPSLVMLLQEIGGNQNHKQIAELLVAALFVQHKLKDTELVFQLESSKRKDAIQKTLGALMEQVISRLQPISARSKQLGLPSHLRKEFRDCIQGTMKMITMSLSPAVFFNAIANLLGNLNESVKKKALVLLSETVKNNAAVHNKRKESGKSTLYQFSLGSVMDEATSESYGEMCSKIVQLIGFSGSDTAVKLAGFTALEVLTARISAHSSIYVSCVASIMKDISSDNLAVSSGCLQAIGSLINALGTRVLSELPQLIEHLLSRARGVSLCSVGGFNTYSDESHGSGDVSCNTESLLLSVLMTLEAVIEKLAAFLNPYLKDIIELMVLQQEYCSESNHKIKQKADSVRRLLTEKMPVRLILDPLLKVYSKAVKCGELSVSESFTMLANVINGMDKPSVRSYHAVIFDHCLLALDLRGKNPGTIQDVDIVEESLIHAMSVLTMKLTETMFRPLFLRSLEWAEMDSVENMTSSPKHLDRNISFYKLVNKFAERQRSLFVPYFKYLLESCTRYLTVSQESDTIQKRKKPKVQKTSDGAEWIGPLSISQWHLRALIISSLHKCFLYDAGNLKFLDSANFQALLKPIVSQLVVEAPPSLEQFPKVPSVREVDDMLVSCLGQMVITAGSDVLWKPLNHEVLMQTRSDKIRARILGLRVVKCLIERLKEEYLIFLAETIPFLDELLQCTELPVKSLAQEILKELETLSGENIQEYF